MENEHLLQGYLEGEGFVSLDRETAPTRIAGASRREKDRLAALEARRNFLAVKLQDVHKSRLNYEQRELSAIEWALRIIQAYFDHLNNSDCEITVEAEQE